MPPRSVLAAPRVTFGPTDYRAFAGLEVPDPITFAVSPLWLNRSNLYPRQATLLKVIFLREDLFSEYDYEVVAEWESNFRITEDNGITPGVLDRMRYLREHGHHWFKEILLVLGRRAGKGFISAVAMAYVLWNYMSKGDPQEFYGVDRDKKLACFIYAGKKEQARVNLWQDLVNVILGGPCFTPYISRPMGETLSVFAPHDFVRMRKLQQRGIPVPLDMATFIIEPKEATLGSGRGPASFCQAYDEMAHQVAGSGTARSAEDIYCLDPSMRVLCSDLIWRPIASLHEGDAIVGFDENSAPGQQRKMREAKVERLWRTRGRALRLHFDDGTSVVCSHNHRWLKENSKGSSWVPAGDPSPGGVAAGLTGDLRGAYDTGSSVSDLVAQFGLSSFRVRELLKQTGIRLPGGRSSKRDDVYPRVRVMLERGESLSVVAEAIGIPYQTLLRWCREEADPGANGPKRNHLRVGDRIRHLVDPWTFDRDVDIAWLAGIFDGEGCLDRESSSSRSAYRISVAQNPGVVLDNIQRVLTDLGFEYRVDQSSAGECRHIVISGLGECLRLLGMLRPYRLLSYNHELWRNRSPRGAGGFTQFKTIVRIEELPEQDLVDIQTSTGTFIAEGLFSHNSAATPALDQFKKDAFIVEPSSPWQQIGQFYTNAQHAVELGEDGQPTYPEMLILQLESWEIYYDWEEAHLLPLFPEGFIGDLGEYEKVEPPILPRLKLAIQEYDEGMQRLEKANPETFRVERRAKWQATIDAYLNYEKIKQMFVPWNDTNLEMRTSGPISRFHKGHADPSLANANFGLAIAHPVVDDNGVTHCVFDYIYHYRPSDFPDDIVDYIKIGDDFWDLIQGFKPDEFTYDQWNSAEAIQRLNKKIRAANFPKKVNVFEKTASHTHNWDRAENFKIALNQGWIHAPQYEQAELELKFLQLKNGKVVKQETGPVQTKDVADCLMECVWTILGEQVSTFRHQALSKLMPQPNVPGRSAEPQPGAHQQLSRAGSRNQMAAGMARFGSSNPARNPSSGRRYR